MSDATTFTTRDVEATRIPSGEITTLPANTQVMLMQALGDSFTVAAPTMGGLFRIDGPDGDAIGREKLSATKTVVDGNLETAVWDALKSCYDPEIPVNIVDLGLVYDVDIDDAPDNTGKRVHVNMTLTAPGCGMGPVIAREAEQKIAALDGVAESNVAVVWEPQWTPDRISRAGRDKLGME
jgi:probable FeS assembly SUF system protein SufT